MCYHSGRDMRHLRRLIPYFVRYRARYLLGLLLAFGGILLLAAIPRVIQDVLNRLGTVGRIDASALTEADLRRAAFLIVALAAGRGVLQFVARVVVVGAGRHIEYDLRNDLFDKLLTLTPSFFHRMKTGDISSRLINDVEGVRVLAGIGLLLGFGMAFMVAVCIVHLVGISPALAALSLLPMAAMGVAMWALEKPLHRLSTEVQDRLAKLSALAQENFSGARVVRAFAQEEPESRRFEAASEDYAGRTLATAKLYAFTWALLTVVMELGVLVTLYAGGRAVGAGTLKPGDLTAFFSYQFLLIWPMIALGWVVSLVQRGGACLERLGEILDAIPDVAGSAETRRGAEDAGKVGGAHVCFRDLTFAYPGASRPALENIDLELAPGSVTGIVGRTGSGKSTLVQLLLRHWRIPDGALLVDGADVNRLPLPAVRARIGVVPQDPFLFSDTIRENIAFGADGAGSHVSGFSFLVSGAGDQKPETRNQKPETGNRLTVEAAARIAGLERDVQGFPQGLDQVIGERGVTLSGGQKQRLAIARAVLRNPRLLILDDALSNVDADTEREILEALVPFFRARTTLLIAHRISTVRLADRIVVLDEGRITERGTHAELLAKNGLYAELARRQRLTEELMRA